MRFSCAIALAGLCLAATSPVPAMAQYAGQDVSVNPVPAGRGVLLYPGGQYTRSVPALLQPGENPNAPIQLHMPAKRRAPVVARTEAPAEAPAPKPVRQAAAPAPDTASSSGYHSDYPDVPTPPAARPAPVEKPLAKPVPAKPAPEKTKIARAEPPPRTSAPPVSDVPLTPGLTKRSVILFAAEATDPSQSALGAIKFLAIDLNKDLTGPGSRIQLQAFGGTRGDKGSDARRLSLKRALAIRQVLIDDGVPADRIDVHAGGGADDSGPTDRVDVYIKA